MEHFFTSPLDESIKQKEQGIAARVCGRGHSRPAFVGGALIVSIWIVTIRNFYKTRVPKNLPNHENLA